MILIDKNQNDDGNGNQFGYVYEADGGGYFFTWMDSLDATLRSIEIDRVDRPRRLGVRRVEQEIRSAWRQESGKPYHRSLIPNPALCAQPESRW